MVGALLALATTWLVHLRQVPPENCTNKADSILKGVQLSQLRQQSNPRISTWLVHFLLGWCSGDHCTP